MLSQKAEQIINNYFQLPFLEVGGVRCPYYINKRSARRGQLRGLIGKGTPQEIIEEAKILSIQYKHGLFDRNGFLQNKKIDDNAAGQMIRRFLIDNGIGIDCSGFVSHILCAHYAETYNINLSKKLFFYPKKRWWRNLIAGFRPIENISVSVLANENNSHIICDKTEVINLDNIRPADIVIILEIYDNTNRNHVLLITDSKNGIIDYVHARAWKSEGQYDHGVSRGNIKITKPNGNILEQQWEEFGKTNEENETYLEAKNSKVLQIRRLNY